MEHKSTQRLNHWLLMFQDIYSHTQNYNKSEYELFGHLVEVVGLATKSAVRTRDVLASAQFCARSFAWICALASLIRPGFKDLEGLLFRKFPGICPYCLLERCGCWQGNKPSIDESRLREAYFGFASDAKNSVNDCQLMFRQIYGHTWGNGQAGLSLTAHRLFEELAELSEAIRFRHLYPDNLENEIADFLAWWFAFVSQLSATTETGSVGLAEDLLWSVYPGICQDCGMIPCFCRPGPVRELVSKPMPGALDRLDRLTLVFNQAAYLDDRRKLDESLLRLPQPLAVARVDLDRFKIINDTHGHAAGDQALRHLAIVMRSKVRERDRIYRAGGDEFVLVCPDSTSEEAAGLARRVCSELKRRPVRWVSTGGQAIEFAITLSVGVAEQREAKSFSETDEAADKAALQSKELGRDRITISID